jgi:RsiW-degrading membrane proteinase PrsW (M82 family)
MSGGYSPNSGRQAGGQFPSSFSFSSLVPVRHWARDPSLRSWPVLLLIALVCVPPIGLVMLNHGGESALHDVAWVFAFYFAVAWLLLLGVIVRPQHVSRAMLATVAGVGIVTEAPIAVWLETTLHSNTGSLGDIFTIGIPEELAKAIPILVVAWLWRREWQSQTPRDYLFLGAVSGLVFGAAEAEHYFNAVLGSESGTVSGPMLQAVTIQYVWRFLTDPISHACWAGITGYFIGLAITGGARKYAIGFVGIAIAAILHGLNDWNPINSHIAWVIVTLVSVLLFLGYARAGAWVPQPGMASSPAAPFPGAPSPAAAAQGPPPGAPWLGPAGPLGYGVPAGPFGSGVPAAPPAGATAYAGTQPMVPGSGGLAAPSGQAVPHDAWWQSPAGGARQAPQPQVAGASPAQPAAAAHPAAATQPTAAGHPAAAMQPTVVTQQPTVVTQRKPAPRPWWEQ